MSEYEYYANELKREQLSELITCKNLLITAECCSIIGTVGAIMLNSSNESEIITKYAIMPIIIAGTILTGAITKELYSNDKKIKQLTNKY